MNKKIVLTSVDAPFIGGAGTNSYNLIKLMRSVLRMKVVGLFIYTEKTLVCDPHNIGNIVSFNPKVDKAENIRNKLVDLLEGPPDMIVSKNYIPVFFMKKMFPKTKLCLLPSGSSFYGQYVNKEGMTTMTEVMKKLSKNELKLNDVIKQQGKWPCYPESCQAGCDCELRALMLADKIVPNSTMTENLFKLLYKNLPLVNKVQGAIMTPGVYDMGTLSGVKRIDFATRKYDVVFIAYNWDRKLKNPELVERIVNHKSMKKYNMLIIGNAAQKIKATNFNTTQLNYMNNKNIFEFLMNTKCLVCPSYYDSFPNVVTEANMCGCNVVCSENIGQAKIIPPRLLVKNFGRLEDWLEKIELAINNKFMPFKIDQIKILKDLSVVLFTNNNVSNIITK
jgi:glycosyltransferase involved in cell wall biosynthesis